MTAARRVLLLAGALAVILAPAASIAASPSFSCEGAARPAEKLVCGSETLSGLDRILADVYRLAMLSADDQEAVQRDQRRWLRRRDTCRTASCVEKAYMERIHELDPSHALPRTADGRLMMKTRRQCRIGFDGEGESLSQNEAIQVQADCIEAGIYDPCEDAGSRWGAAQCALANTEVARRRSRRAHELLRDLARGLPDEKAIHQVLEREWKAWETRKDMFCEAQNRRFQEAIDNATSVAPGDAGERYRSCETRLARLRADELETLAGALEAASAPSERTRLLSDFLRKRR
jgi:uncharacterized protein